MKLKATVGALAATLAFSVAPVQASVVAMADLAISNFLLVQLTGIDDSPFSPVTSVNITSEGRTGNATSLYNSAPGPGPTSVNVIGSGAADIPYQCSGDCVTILPSYVGGLENNFSTHITTPIADYALADMVITGTAISVGTNALTRANMASTGGANNGNANSTILNGVTATTTFTVGTAIDNVAFFLNYDVFVKAFVSGDAVDGFASAGNSWSLSVTKTGGAADFTPLIWSPGELNRSFTSNGLPSNAQYLAAGLLFSPTRTLTEGTYQLTILQASNATIDEKVPEPGTLLLAGLALAGLGVARRRRS